MNLIYRDKMLCPIKTHYYLFRECINYVCRYLSALIDSSSHSCVNCQKITHHCNKGVTGIYYLEVFLTNLYNVVFNNMILQHAYQSTASNYLSINSYT